MAALHLRIESLLRLIEKSNSISDRSEAAKFMMSGARKIHSDPSLYNSRDTKYSDAFVSEMELSFRQYTTRLINDMARDSEGGASRTIRFLGFSVNYTIAEEKWFKAKGETSPFGKLPFILLEDILEGQSINNCRVIWQWLEEVSGQLSSAGLFLKGRIILLRMCNGLLKQMSKMYDATLAGRVLSFLATSHCLNERSGVNIGGHKNLDHETEFETKEEFELHLSEMKNDNNKKMENENEESEEPSEGAVDYDLYESFWSLQQVFANPEKLTSNTQEWEKFQTKAKKILKAFRANGTRFDKKDRKKSLNSRKEIIKTISKGASTLQKLQTESDAFKCKVEEGKTFFNCNYLTSIRLFHLELRDPTVRLQFLTQLMMLVKALALPLATRASASHQISDEYCHQLSLLSKDVLDAMEQSHWKGKEYFVYIAKALQREESWEMWKNLESCKSFEREPQKIKSLEEALKNLKPKAPTKQMKRHHCEILPTEEEEGLYSRFTPNLNLASSNFSFKRPKVEEHFKFLEECLDPSSGVEDEYLPTKNEKFNWQSRRLLVQTRLELVDAMPTGDVLQGWNAMKKKMGKFSVQGMKSNKIEEIEKEDGEVPNNLPEQH
mmetsp:Transcript_16442/g.24354  ORF Transcript_16442/g.24354 Transcript_16442/m.24354 type:complete len:609 (-) Transcript_16442:53-1879(-)